jgi:hypothetical protein
MARSCLQLVPLQLAPRNRLHSARLRIDQGSSNLNIDSSFAKSVACETG